MSIRYFRPYLTQQDICYILELSNQLPEELRNKFLTLKLKADIGLTKPAHTGAQSLDEKLGITNIGKSNREQAYNAWLTHKWNCSLDILEQAYSYILTQAIEVSQSDKEHFESTLFG